MEVGILTEHMRQVSSRDQIDENLSLTSSEIDANAIAMHNLLDRRSSEGLHEVATRTFGQEVLS